MTKYLQTIYEYVGIVVLGLICVLIIPPIVILRRLHLIDQRRGAP